MKIPSPRKLPSGRWFIQLRLGGESVSITEDTEKKCIASARYTKAEYLAGKRTTAAASDTLTLRQAIDKYIASRVNTLSPSTVRGYYTIRDNRFIAVQGKRMDKITDWQSICNTEAEKCSPKTLENAWIFIASVLRFSDRPVPRVTLPQVVIKERLYIEPDKIPAFIAAIKGTKCEISALLALHSLRRSEVCALKWDDIDLPNGRFLVNGALVQGADQKFVTKETNKNDSSRRYVPIMIPELRTALDAVPDKTGYVVTCAPETICRQINRVCEAHGLPSIGAHGLRHSFASLAYHLQIPEKIAMQIGGWADYETMRKIYTHLSQKDVDKYSAELVNFFKNANENANESAK